MKRTLVVLLVAVGAFGGGCGWNSASSSEPGPTEAVASAQRSLDQRKAGRIEFSLTAAAEDSEPVGFAIEGEYAFEEGRELAVLDLTYRQILGEGEIETNVISDGERAWVVVDGESTRLTEAQTGPLRVSDDGTAGGAVPDLNLSEWLEDGRVKTEGTNSTVEGEVRASALISDLQDVAAQVSGRKADDLEDDAAEQIDRAVESSRLTLESDGGSLRRLKAVVDFGARVPPELRTALGAYAGARLELSMSVGDVETPLKVRVPQTGD